MLESLNYSFRNPQKIIWVIYRIKPLGNYKKNIGCSEDPSLVNNVDKLGLVYWGLNELEVRVQYQMKISKRFAALENLNDGEDINMAREKH